MADESKNILETERMILREWTREDAAALFEICRNAELMLHIGHRKPYENIDAAAEFLNWATAYQNENGYCRWAVIETSSGKIIGSCRFARRKMLTLTRQAIESLRAAYQRLKSAFEQQLGKESRRELLEAITTAANEVEPLVNDYPALRSEYLRNETLNKDAEVRGLWRAGCGNHSNQYKEAPYDSLPHKS